jgi:hypothetical protein
MADIITAKTGLYPNYAALFVALFVDPPFLFDDRKITAAGLFITNMAIIAPTCEAASMDSGKPLLPMNIEDIDYQGVTGRRLPEKGKLS